MKKIISIVIILALALSFYACGSKATDSTTTTTATTSPEPSYAAMLVVSINPAFRLYLDNDGTVINMESGNTDADAIKDQIVYEGKSFEEVVKSIILAAHTAGYLDADGKVTFNIYEARGIDADDVLAKAQAVASSTAAELEVQIEVESEDKTVEDPIDDVITTTSPTEDTTTTTTQPSDNTTTAPSVLNPNDYIQQATEYIGNFKEIDGGLRASAIYFDGEYCVITERYFTSEKPEDDVPSITFNGKEYYSEGGGQNPYYFRLTDTEVIVTIPAWDNATADTVTLRLVFQSADTLKVIESRSTLFPAGTILSSDINSVLR